MKRIHIRVEGIVQGVGFRPFVYKTAVSSGLAGYVTNTSQGVEIELEGFTDAVDSFLRILKNKPPKLSKIISVETRSVAPLGDKEFIIRKSMAGEGRTALISPDMSVCDDCLAELFDPENRRFHYPFINCTNCGPRYTIILDIPYDRPKTTMRAFTMCPGCRSEYEDPANRRFHAQPNACPECGPEIWFESGSEKVKGGQALEELTGLLRRGGIAAVKGLGGFHLVCDAYNEEAVARLRQRKNREEKPLALMVPDSESASDLVKMTGSEKMLLEDQKRPIVLMLKSETASVAASVAPDNSYLGIMLPYTPLHFLIMQNFRALVMTSGNLSEEPIAIENGEARSRLAGIADGFLMHNRDIHLRSDDSVSRIMAGTERPVRRSRGMVPVPVLLKRHQLSVLAVGPELKNTLCLTKGDRAYLSQHIGDMENQETLEFFHESVEHLTRILEIKPQVLAHDNHPDYMTTQYAVEQTELPVIPVQHHHAHIASCLAENGSDEKVIGLAFDGTGYGEDGAVWGGEVLIADLKSFERAAHIEYRRMPGSHMAIREPWRMALSYLFAALSNREHIDESELYKRIKHLKLMQEYGDDASVVVRMLRNGLNSPETSSLGRLFDGVSALAGIRQRVAFEGQAAMMLEMALKHSGPIDPRSPAYTFEFSENGGITIDPDPLILEVVRDTENGIPLSEISLKFHSAVVNLFSGICNRLRELHGIGTVALSGGCFQNRTLLESLILRLSGAGFRVLTHSKVPANDGGIALGQAVIAASVFEGQ